MRATLENVLTDEAFERMIALGERFEAGVDDGDRGARAAWHVTRLGCRAEYAFARRRRATAREAAPPSTASSTASCTSTPSTAASCSRPFHNMALMSPATTEADVDLHTDAFAEAAGDLAAPST